MTRKIYNLSDNGENSIRNGKSEENHHRLYEITKKLLPHYGTNWHRQSLVTLKTETLSGILALNEIYQKILDIPGAICEFGVHWGATSSTLINLRNLYEPYNYTRVLYSFDTFEGFVNLDNNDGELNKIGDYKSLPNYEKTLEEILKIHEGFGPNSHLQKFELIKGDASITIDTWLEENPQATIALAIFDMDLYAPTKKVLEKIIPRLTKGSVLLFDELNCKNFPGETQAVDEVLGINNLKLRKLPWQAKLAYAIYGE